MKILRKFNQIVITLGIAFTGLACGGSGGGDASVPPPPPPSIQKSFSAQLVEVSIIDVRNGEVINVESLPIDGNQVTLE